MAVIDLTTIEPESLDMAETYETAFATGHTIGDIIRPNGVVNTGATQSVGGIVIRPGNADGDRTLVLRRGVVRGISGAGAAANARIFLDGANTAGDTEPTPGVGGKVHVLGDMISATRALIDPFTYEVEA